MPQRLSTRILFSYALLAALLLVAFLFAVHGLVRVNELVDDLMGVELANMEHAEAIHLAAWKIEVGARRSLVECDQDSTAGARGADRIRQARMRLQEVLGNGGDSIHPGMRQAAAGYVRFASEIEAVPTCEMLMSIPLREKRLQLDEELTNAWEDRLRELRLAILDKQVKTARIGARATWIGAVIGSFSLLVAALFAVLMSRNIARSMTQLSKQARRVGEGDFTPLPPQEGPAEVRALSLEFDRMRARLAEIDQLKQAFIASISHDLRTPLTRVREALGLLADGTTGPLNERQARVVSLARAACEREIRLVTSLLDLSRIRSGQPLRRETGSNLDRVVELVLQSLSDEAEERGVRLVYKSEGALPGASLDSALVERALSNLVSNAISVSTRGQTVEIERKVTANGPPQSARRSSGWIQVFVRDEGPGVPEAVRGRLFTPFVSSEATPRREYRGFGLGLSIAWEMIRAHGGEIALIDEPRSGAIFCVWLPLENRPPAGHEVPMMNSVPASSERA